MERCDIERFSLGKFVKDLDTVAIELPLSVDIVFGAQHHRSLYPLTTIMRTPGDDIVLVLGLLFSLGIIDDLVDIIDILPCRKNFYESKPPTRLTVSLSYEKRFFVDRVLENMIRFTSCGVCSSYEIPPSRNNNYLETAIDTHVTSSILTKFPKTMALQQTIFQKTGGVHAAAVYNTNGAILSIFEDIGRHNALDKLIGHAILCKEPLKSSITLLSSRASFEIIQKAARANIPVVAVMGAVSSLAISVAKQCGITLVGFLREDRFNVYTYPERIIA